MWEQLRTLEGPDRTEAFRDDITTELDVQINALDTSDGTVDLTYSSRFGISSGDASFEIGFIGAAFARHVDQGWNIDELVATVTDGNGDQYRYTVDADFAMRWEDGELDDDEFTFGLLDAMDALDDANSVAAKTPLFRSWIQAETGVEITSLGTANGAVDLAYDSTNSIESQAGINEVGDIGTIFALMVDDDWPAERVDGALTDGERDDYTFAIDRETALDWAQGRISDQEYAEAVQESVEPA